MDIVTRGNLSSILVANIDLTYNWQVCMSRRGGEGCGKKGGWVVSLY